MKESIGGFLASEDATRAWPEARMQHYLTLKT